MEFRVEAGDLLRLDGGSKGTVLHCVRGTVWLTKGDGVDYLLHQESRHEIKAGEASVVEALGTAEVRVEAVGCERGGRSAIGQRMLVAASPTP